MPIFHALLSLKWLLKTIDVYKEKAEEQLQEIVNSVKTICLGPTVYVQMIYIYHWLSSFFL